MIVDIYLSSLSRYVQGNENGEWLTLPMSNEELTNKFSEIVGKGKEWIILEKYGAPFEIGEYENVFKLNEFMQNINSYGLDEEEIQILAKVYRYFKKHLRQHNCITEITQLSMLMKFLKVGR